MIKKIFSLTYIRILLLILAATLIFIGIMTGEHLSVLQKSIRICLECIGIG